MNRLTQLSLRGFKSIRRLDNFELRPLNVLIGPNGAGKSNLISYFRMLGRMMAAPPNLAMYVLEAGGANALLFDGAEVTSQLSTSLSFASGTVTSDYSARLTYATSDRLIFESEVFVSSARPGFRVPFSAHVESALIREAEVGDQDAAATLQLLRQCRVFQFHNTSPTARIRQLWSEADNVCLKEDAGNLAPVLRRLRTTEPAYYARITDTIRLVYPLFADFVLEPEGDSIRLRWQEIGSDMVWTPHQVSDGTLRAMALITLLLQPESSVPDVVILDEPELGLHPYAISVIAGLLRSVSAQKQVVIATQSTTLVDQFQPEDIVVVERRNRESTFRRLVPDELADWLAEYTLSELWEKNVFGGPARTLIRLHVIAEGQTEETFINTVLASHLGDYNISTDVRRILTSKKVNRPDVQHKGGGSSYDLLKKDLVRWLREDGHSEARFTTMVDLYALRKGFPVPDACPANPHERVVAIEAAFAQDVGNWRFIPYVQLHEFESLLLADPDALLHQFPGRSHEVQNLKLTIAGFASPEHVDDGSETAPSKRIIQHIPEYKGAKQSAGPLTAARIGLPALRRHCKHFDEWLTTLERLGQPL